MAERPRGMGRGLAAILAVTDEAEGAPRDFRDIPTELISPNPHQPRQDFDEESLVMLAESIKVQGVLQAVLVRPVPGGTYELAARTAPVASS